MESSTKNFQFRWPLLSQDGGRLSSLSYPACQHFETEILNDHINSISLYLSTARTIALGEGETLFVWTSAFWLQGPELRLRHRACWQSDPGQPDPERRDVSSLESSRGPKPVSAIPGHPELVLDLKPDMYISLYQGAP